MFDFPVWVIVQCAAQGESAAQVRIVCPDKTGEIFLSQKEAAAQASGEFQPRAIGSYRGLLLWAQRAQAAGLQSIVSRRGIRSDPPIDLYLSADEFIAMVHDQIYGVRESAEN
ncbi:MAG: hypothetical protein MUF06_21350 [Pirellulaceae bacterium]|jgi:hypothetical protein|nr:hypothetical protein [Pirellulaceae bacterium]